MNNAKSLVSCLFIATSALSASAFADAQGDWIAYRKANGLPTDPTPSVPYVSPLPLLIQMARTDGDTDVDAITLRFNAMYKRLATGNASIAGGGNGGGDGNDERAYATKGFSCDKALFTQLAKSDGYRPGEPVGCPD